MGCGMVSQRGSTVLEVHRPIARDSGGRPSAALRDASQRSHAASSGEISSSRRRAASNRERSGDAVHDGSDDHGERQPGQQGGRHNPRRFMVGERITLTTRLPHNIQDHAFCFECGVFFHCGSMTNPECANCGSSFIQFLRSAQDQNWISADNPNAEGFSFDDQLDNSITASLDETPIPKKPTQAGFLQSLKTVHLDKSEVNERALLDASDPRCNCAICRDTFAVGDKVQKLPCNHEFHADCIQLWLKGNNTCPICRWQLPEAVEGAEEQEQEVRAKANQAPADSIPAAVSDEAAPDAEEEEPIRRRPSDGEAADEAVEEEPGRYRPPDEVNREAQGIVKESGCEQHGSLLAAEGEDRSRSPSDLPGVASRSDEGAWCRGATGEPKPSQHEIAAA